MPNTSSWATFPAAKDPDRIHRYSDDEDDNFDFIEDGADKGLPKYMEWYGAFSLMITLIWLYIEILRLLMKLRSR